MSRLSLLAGGLCLLVGSLVACMPTDALDAEAPGTPGASEAPTPSFTLLSVASQYQAIATFRSTEGVALGDSAAVFEVGDEVHRAPLASGPSQYEEPGGATVTQAAYVLGDDAYRALVTMPADSVEVTLQIGEGTRTFPFRRGDVIE